MIISDYVYDKEIEALNHIKRWYLNRTQRIENIAEHSFWVSFFVNILNEDLIVVTEKDKFNEEYLLMVNSLKLRNLQKAILHDVDEAFTGDIPHQVKHNPHNGADITAALKEFTKVKVEEKWCKDIPSNRLIKDILLSDTNTISGHIVKICDWLSFCKYAYTESILGNHDFAPIQVYCSKSLAEQVEKTKLRLKDYSLATGVKFNYEVLDTIIEKVK